MTANNEGRILLIPAMAAVAAAVAIVILRIFDPATSGIFPPCPFHALTGWYCPGCGSLRAFHQLLHGNLRQALALNAFAVVASPFLAYGALSYALFQVRGKYLPRLFLPAFWIRALCAAIIVFAILRNVPVYPLSLLAPRGLSAAQQMASQDQTKRPALFFRQSSHTP
ncbi:MAG TPA: DUF2752 domain-containing protein [Terriglobales bacterium]|nr:DUF2752 domain-containing protein [Terriglobales bacterium]